MGQGQWLAGRVMVRVRVTVALRPPCAVSETRNMRSSGTVTSQLKYWSHGSLMPLVSSNVTNSLSGTTTVAA